MRLDYNRDEAKAKTVVDDRWAKIKASPKLDISAEQKAIWARYAKQPIANSALGRDSLTVYAVERNRQGDVFVLYTLRGYHGSADHSANYLRLKDRSGTEWLSDVISFYGTRVRLNGQVPKAQVFFHPSGLVASQKLQIFAKMTDWEFEPSNVEIPLKRTWNRQVSIATAVPQELPFLQPDWMHYAFNVDDPEWLQCNALKLRFIHALRQKRYPEAQQFGLKLESIFPPMMGGFFYDRPQLYLGLYKAFLGTGDRAKAREYLKKAIDRWQESSGDSFVTRDLDQARKQEGL